MSSFQFHYHAGAAAPVADQPALPAKRKAADESDNSDDAIEVPEGGHEEAQGQAIEPAAPARPSPSLLP